eukprot:12413021-Karenia_brevis.AAC.1
MMMMMLTMMCISPLRRERHGVCLLGSWSLGPLRSVYLRDHPLGTAVGGVPHPFLMLMMMDDDDDDDDDDG